MKTGIFYFTTCFHGFGILRHVDPFVKMLHKYAENSIRYCLIRQLNSEVTWASTIEIKKHGFHNAMPTIQNFN